ncbi:hypothetical protein XI01_31005 [Bradyrhizobium sp. CCBAU 21360]|nr:hypothetical protein [Bradyrhizobium sp. CCBAU 21360]
MLERIKLTAQIKDHFDRVLVIFLLGPPEVCAYLLFTLFETAHNRITYLTLIEAEMLSLGRLLKSLAKHLRKLRRFEHR